MKCLKCGTELTTDMFTSGMCFECGTIIEQSNELFQENTQEKQIESNYDKPNTTATDKPHQDDKETSAEIKNKTAKHPIRNFFLFIILIIAAVISVCIIKDKNSSNEVKKHLAAGDWEVVSTQEYVRDGKKCIGYRVYVNYDYASTDVYKDIFSYVTDDDYYLHTVWIYYVKNMANGSYSADYTMEQTRSSEIPEPVR